MKVRIALDKMSDVVGFVNAVSGVPHEVFLSDGKRQQVCAKSQLGAILAKMEWDEIYCECEADIYAIIARYTAE